MIERRKDWRPRLEGQIITYRKKPFEWGKVDCALFAADCIQAMTDFDPALKFRGNYGSEETARDLLKQLGYKDHVAVFAESFAKVHISRVVVGDLAVIKGDKALGIVIGPHIAVLGPNGLGNVPLKWAMKTAYKVG